MKDELNLAPIEELLTTGIKPKELVEELDEILFDYMETIINLHLRKGDDEDFIHSEIPNYLFRIRELRNVFWKCAE